MNESTSGGGGGGGAHLAVGGPDGGDGHTAGEQRAAGRGGRGAPVLPTGPAWSVLLSWEQRHGEQKNSPLAAAHQGPLEDIYAPLAENWQTRRTE